LCPSLHQPILSGDGYLVRIRPKFGQLNSHQLNALAEASSRFGNGVIEITTRANISLRGIDLSKVNDLSDFLKKEKIINENDSPDNVANIIYSPFTDSNEKGFSTISTMIEDQLPSLPSLHKKFGLAVDIGKIACLQHVNADLRIEKTFENSFILRIDGLDLGQEVEEKNIIPSIKKLIYDLSVSIPKDLKEKSLSKIIHRIDFYKFHFPTKKPRPQNFMLKLGPYLSGYLISSSAGRFTGGNLLELSKHLQGINFTPWKALFIEKTSRKPKLNFLLKNTDLLFKISHCVGSPYCKQAQVDTLGIANKLNKKIKLRLKNDLLKVPNIHISGCSKNCGKPKDISITIRKSNKDSKVIAVSSDYNVLAQDLILELNNEL
jgi:precorrin-3B synthase